MNPSRWRAAALTLMFLLAGCTSSVTPLHEAARSGNTEVVRSYVQAKRNLDPRWDEPSHGLEGNYARLIGLTPLMLAARYGQLEVAKLLVEGGADIYAQANTQLPGKPMTAFDFAVQEGHFGIAEYLWKKSDGVRLGTRLADQIASACRASCKEGAGTDAGSNLALFLISIAPDEIAGAGVGAAACYSPQPLDLLAFVEKYSARPPRNTLDPPKSIAMQLVEGPFRSLSGTWTFAALGESGCKVALALDFEYTGRLMAPIMRAGFEKVADRMVDDFCREAMRIYA